MTRYRHLPRSRRLFTRRRSRFTTTLLALAAIVVAGCTPPPAEPPHKDYSDIKVEWVALGHDVTFSGPPPGVGDAVLAGIDAFLDRVDVRPTDQIALDPGANTDRALAQARADAIAQRLRQRLPGVRVRVLDDSDRDGPQLVVGRYVAVPLECAGWMSPEQRYAAFANPDNTPDPNFGCATASILAAMIADPGDLVRGRDLAPAEGAPQALSIELYKKGESPHPHTMNHNKRTHAEIE